MEKFMKERLLAVVALSVVLAVPTAFAGPAERLAALRTKGIEERLSLDELHEARELLRPSAEASDAEAQIGLANSYFRTEIGRKSKYLKDAPPPECFYHFCTCAAQGNVLTLR